MLPTFARMVRVFFLCLLALSAAAQAPTPSVISPDDRALYGVINRASGRSLDLTKASKLSGAAAVQWDFTHAPSLPIYQLSEASKIVHDMVDRDANIVRFAVEALRLVKDVIQADMARFSGWLNC